VSTSLCANIHSSAGALKSERLVLISLWVAASNVNYSVDMLLFSLFGIVLVLHPLPSVVIFTTGFRRQILVDTFHFPFIEYFRLI